MPDSPGEHVMQRGTVTAAKSLLEGSNASNEQPWREIQEALQGLQYGSVTVVVQDGLVVQVERLEKRRLVRGSGKG
jgi:hypothetical protein